jgi:hypothetical protein
MQENFPGIYPTTFCIDLYSLTTSNQLQAVPSSAVVVNVVFQLHQGPIIPSSPSFASTDLTAACFDGIFEIF